jgi:hypothetical protein
MTEQAVGVRDSRGRWRDGVSSNPQARPRVALSRKRLLKLLSDAEAAGGRIIVLFDPAPADRLEAA